MQGKNITPSERRGGCPPRAKAPGLLAAITGEGEKTEYGYFHDIRRSLRMEPNKIIVIKPEGSDPLSVVREAVDERTSRKESREWTEGDFAWAAFDGDEHIANNRANWNGALQLARREGIRLAISNPSFEYWYLLHYQDQTGHLTRQEARRRLEVYLPDYEKSDVLYRKALRERTEAALCRARQVARLSGLHDVGLYDNPCAHVWELVELVLSLRHEER